MRIGVIGATSFIGRCLIPLLTAEAGWEVTAFSRRAQDLQYFRETNPVDWQLLQKVEPSQTREVHPPEKQISHWVCLAPIWGLPEYLPMLSIYGVKHVVAISSTSRFTKCFSSDTTEQALAKRLADGEEHLIAWAKTKEVTWTILRPTMIYGLGSDKNISVIARFIRHFAFFPFPGTAMGLRQPVHVNDVALSCLAALNICETTNRSYNLSGGETLPYREMIGRIFSAIGKSPRFVTFPLWTFRMAVKCLRIIPRFRHLSAAMAERMNQDLIFDHEDAARDLGFSPRPFLLTHEDLPE
ncbi:MAG: NAD(P)-dependent oxidoreductase [Desulfobacteraceae bacterium]|nr:MAG: NAD(P)-dependent oxidoreductase [Desulfobacteraceae bacterium]